MPNSLAQTADVPCPNCGRPFNAGIWLVVDINERPDLLAHLRAGDLHTLRCPHCGADGSVDVPLLVYTAGGLTLPDVPPLLFSPAQQTTDEQDREQAGGLLQALATALGDAWQGAWMQQMEFVLRPLLPIALSEEPAAALKQLRQSDPDLWQALQKQAAAAAPGQAEEEEIPENARPLLQELERLTGVLQMGQRVDVCRQLLARLDRRAQPRLWAAVQGTLGISLAQNPGGERAENLELAIAAYQQALAVMTRATMPLEWARTTMNLAAAYYARIRGERAKNLEQAIAAYQQALEVRTRAAMPVEWAKTTSNLANAYAERIRGERAENLEMAIAAYQQALEVRTRAAMPVEWAETTSNLAAAYAERIRGERAENLEMAIAASQQALEVRTRAAMPLEWAETTMNLATAYAKRIRGEQAENLDLAIAAYQQALAVMTQDALPVKWAMTTSNLAGAYSIRIRGERAENLEQAIASYQQALEVRTHAAMPVDWAETMMNLANAYSIRIRGERAENVEQAIAAYQQALEVTTRAAMPLEWAETTMNLATAYAKRIRGERAENLEMAIAAYQQALGVRTRAAMPLEWATTTMNLANAYQSRIRGKRAENLEQAIAGFQQALEVRTQDALPADFQSVSAGLGRLLLEMQRWEAAAVHLRHAVETGQLLYTAAATPEARQAVLARLGDVSLALAYALVRHAPLDRAALEQAVVAVETNRARWLAESMALDAGKPPAVAAATWQIFQSAAAAFRALETEARLPACTPGQRSFLELSAALAAARRDLEAAVQAVRGEDAAFLPAPTFAQIAAAAPASRPLVYLVAVAAGGLALIVHGGCVSALPLPALSAARVREWLFGPADDAALGGWLSAYRSWQRQPNPAARRAWQATVDDVTRRLGEQLMQPLAAALRPLLPPYADAHPPVVTLIPSGLLALLPLHAAWLPAAAGAAAAERPAHRYFCDEFALQYAPSAQALHYTRRRELAPGDEPLLAVDEPLPLTLGGPLPNSAREVTAVGDHFAHPVLLRGAQATRAAVLQALPGAAVVHFSCHGGNDWADPLQSGLRLAHNQLLSVRDLLGLHLAPARLAVLSACETGIVGANLPDEVVMLPTALLQAGFAGVLASLWSVPDVSTAMLMVRFYDCWRQEGLEPVYALRAAQQWLRESTNAEKAAYFRAALPRGGATRMPTAVAEEFFDDLLELRPGERDFAHPHWWAAFYLTGS